MRLLAQPHYFLHHYHKTLTRMSSSSPSSSPHQIVDYDQYLNTVAKKRQPSLIRELSRRWVSAEPGTIFMAGGAPHPQLFPFQSLQVTLDDHTQLCLDTEQMKAALQYQPTLGYPPLHQELKKLVEHFFHPPSLSTGREVAVTVGSQNGLCALLEMTLAPGDPVLIPAPVYSSALNIMDPHSPLYLPIAEDAQGMQPHLLEETLKERQSAGAKMPKLLYLNPTGCNPTGIVIPTERKREIYSIARAYSLLILEDDPYYFLHFQPHDPTTFLSLDVDGRVVRLDSFSKILSSGLRVGFTTGPKPLIRVLEMSLQASILHCSSLSQVLVDGVLSKWGIPGFIQHTNKVKEFYRGRRDLMVAAAHKHLKGLASWNVPQGGMFVWMKVEGVADTYPMLMERGLAQKIMLLPGCEFMADRKAPSPYLRASFSIVPPQQIDQGMERLAALIREEQKHQK